MTFITKMIKAFCIVIFLSFSYLGVANAEQIDKSVKEAYADPEQSKEKKTEDKTPSENVYNTKTSSTNFTFSDFFRMIAATIFVVALLYFMLRFMNNKTKGYQKGNLITNLGGTSLGSNKSIQIVKIGEKVYVVGVGEDVQLLTEIKNEDEIEQILATYNQKVDQKLVPSDIITKWYKKIKNEPVKNDPFTEQLKEQLNEMKNNRKQLREVIEKKVNTDNE
ncbi:flagellar biosynthetic protein FliO [Bacillus massiliigorillae]|uniref:flagellar biosynthetic protein FliO n=1 Tax=Bacillus massiliigorillae TaxID=1243664 RepID=UPI00039E3D20|nr:flagellar biosynthetic protein FliO [Bacillus massiliigorillae]